MLGTKLRLGKNHTEETKLKISISNKGKTLGDKNTNWKGGITGADKLLRTRFRQTVHKKVLERDRYRCVICGKGGYIHVDHIKRWSEYPELRFDIDNCRTLCMEHHYYVTFGRSLPTGVMWGTTQNKATRRVG